MSQRNYYPPLGSLDPEVVNIHAVITFGASGAPTITRGKGIKSVTRSSAGVFVFVFGATAGTGVDVFPTLLGVDQPTFLKATQPSAPQLEITTNAVATTGSLTVTLRAPGAGASATDPASGEIGYFRFVATNSKAP